MITFKKKIETKLNKCDYCDLQKTIQPITQKEIREVDKWFSDINELHEAKLIPRRYSKAILIPENTTLYCLINSKYWHTKKKKCPYWQATIGASADSAISLHYARRTTNLTTSIYWLTAVMAVMAIHPWLGTNGEPFQISKAAKHLYTLLQSSFQYP